LVRLKRFPSGGMRGRRFLGVKFREMSENGGVEGKKFAEASRTEGNRRDVGGLAVEEKKAAGSRAWEKDLTGPGDGREKVLVEKERKARRKLKKVGVKGPRAQARASARAVWGPLVGKKRRRRDQSFRKRQTARKKKKGVTYEQNAKGKTENNAGMQPDAGGRGESSLRRRIPIKGGKQRFSIIASLKTAERNRAE